VNIHWASGWTPLPPGSARFGAVAGTDGPFPATIFAFPENSAALKAAIFRESMALAFGPNFDSPMIT